MLSLPDKADPSDKDDANMGFVQQLDCQQYGRGNVTSGIGLLYS
jgi:hypothetical protein